MRETDGRGRRLAIVSDALMNAHLTQDGDAIAAIALLEERGYGLMALPPATLAESAQEAAIAHLMDQLSDYLRHGYAAVLIEDVPDDPQLHRLDAACGAVRSARLKRIPVGPAFRAALDAASDPPR